MRNDTDSATAATGKTGTAPPSRPLLGIALKIGSTLMFTVMLTLIKIASDGYPIGEIVFFRSVFALIPLIIWVGLRGSFATLFRTSNYAGHVKRSLAGTAAIFLNFGALFFLPVADATAIGYSMPLMTVALAMLVLHEVVQPYRWVAVVVGFAGILIILSGYLGQGELGGGYAFGAALSLTGSLATALAFIQIRSLTRSEGPNTIVLHFTLITTAFSLLTAPFGWVLPDTHDAAVLIAIGFAGGTAQILTTQSYRFSGASNVAPFEYTSMIWALAASWLVFGTWPSVNVFIGAAIVILGGLFVVHRDRAQPPSPGD
jgi:drug/metabolite transporter (DMT)-like permease